MKRNTLFRRHIALPGDHGSWVFLLSPLLIGLFAGGNWTEDSLILVVGALAAFLLRQPFIIATKAYAGRRSRNDLPAARFWILVYGLLAAASLTVLIMRGYQFLLLLAAPGVLVFGWYLWLVRRRAERHKIGLDIIASGVLALAAPAALWVSAGKSTPLGWWLWVLTWLQSAASIVYAFMRLGQRSLTARPDTSILIQLGRRAFLYCSFNLISVAIISSTGILPNYLWVPYALQWIECIYGVFYPAMGIKPTSIGIRQLIISVLFTGLFIMTWGA